MGSTILAAGHYAPERRVSNAELEAQLGLESGWIEQRTGIRERRWVTEGEALTDIAIRAGEMALSRAGLARSRIGLLVLATSTPDHLLPPSAPLVAHRLGLTAGAIDLAGACAGYLYALTFADGFVRTHNAPVLVIAANILSRRTNLAERSSAILFADAAGATLIGPTERRRTGVLGAKLASDGSCYDLIKIPAGGSRKPFRPTLDPTDTLMQISDGRAVFSKAVAMMAETSLVALQTAGLGVSDVNHWIPHQANSRIIAASQRRLGLGDSTVISSVAEYGNSSAATIPFSLSLATETREFKSCEVLLMSAAGAGMTGGSVVWGL
jgi:3-oxoacyl-[acyl-carrier-protein] synthase-3